MFDAIWTLFLFFYIMKNEPLLKIFPTGWIENIYIFDTTQISISDFHFQTEEQLHPD